jgi:hypothetical protein
MGNEIYFKIARYVDLGMLNNFEVNPITHLGVVALFSSNLQNVNTFRLIFQKL